ncbi:YcaO-like family protein [Candidatus Kaiserbacteria bacterium]|nr:YcaO-like family protein [Candidatus Kaiserbacteria bacterium]
MGYFLIPTATKHDEEWTISERGVRLFATHIAAAAGLSAVKDARRNGLSRPDLKDVLRNYRKLADANIATAFGTAHAFPDEPPMRSWWVDMGGEKAGGLSVRSDKEALRAAVSEAQERHIWRHEHDYFRGTACSTFDQLGGGKAIDPLRFAGYSNTQRNAVPRLSVTKATQFLWTKGRSLVQKKSLLLPAQIVSRVHAHDAMRDRKEPMLREPITTGVATHPDKTQAILSGLLEAIERDAFMIMWLNRLSLPQVARASIAENNSALHELLARCDRYNLRVHFVRLITDAPAHVIMVVVRDSANLPPFSVGTSAHASASHAAEKALLEALRARKNARDLVRNHATLRDEKNITFTDRHIYWADPAKAHMMDFLTSGREAPLENAEWENDVAPEHLERITKWCQRTGYECLYVDLGVSKKNVLGFYVVFAVIPELQPLYLNEKNRCEGGERLHSIPKQFGYLARSEVFADVPHPFV